MLYSLVYDKLFSFYTPIIHIPHMRLLPEITISFSDSFGVLTRQQR